MHSSYNPACNDGLEQDSHAPADGRVVTAFIHTYDSVTRGEAVMRMETRACATSRFASLDQATREDSILVSGMQACLFTTALGTRLRSWRADRFPRSTQDVGGHQTGKPGSRARKDVEVNVRYLE